MIDTTIAAVGPLVLIAIGVGMLWLAARRIDGYATRNDVGAALLRASGWVMLVVGILIMLLFMSHVFALFMWIATIVVIVSAVSRYFAAEQQGLLWALTVAAERGIPLESAARSFAEERNDRVGRRATLLADYLEAGVPLSLALTRSKTFMPAPVMLAADLGQESGNLGMALRQAAGEVDESEVTLRWTLERLFYLAFLLLVGCSAITFLMLYIMPMFSKMFEEFGMELPQVTIFLIRISEIAEYGWPLLVPLLLVWIAFVVFGMGWYMGISRHNLPIVNRLWRSADCALVLRWLANAVRKDLSMAETIRALATRFPQRDVRARLEHASSRIDRGADWCDSLRSAGLIRRSESALFKTAARVGNLDWALEEMASGGMRRAAYRFRAWMNILFPVALLLLGVAVLIITAGVLMPLVALIDGLA